MERRQRAVLLCAQPHLHVVVARERVGLQVLHPVLDPLHRLADHHRSGHRDHVSRIHRHLAAEAAADVGRDDADALLRQADVPRDQREHRAHRVRRLGGHVDRELALGRVEVGDAAAGLHRRHVDARHVHVLLGDDLRSLQRFLGVGAVARLPVEGEVVLLVFLVLAQHRRAGCDRLQRVDHHRQRLVIDLDRVGAVGGDIALGGDHRAHLLRLVHHFVGRQHHLRVGRDGRHPVQLVFLERGAVDHRKDAGDLQRLRGIDLLDPRVRVRAAHDVHVQHPGQLDVVDVVALAADEARVFLALHGVTHAADFCIGPGSVHGAPPIFWAACWTAFTILRYPVQRHRLPEIAWRISCSLGLRFCSSSALHVMSMPGVQ